MSLSSNGTLRCNKWPFAQWMLRASHMARARSYQLDVPANGSSGLSARRPSTERTRRFERSPLHCPPRTATACRIWRVEQGPKSNRTPSRSETRREIAGPPTIAAAPPIHNAAAVRRPRHILRRRRPTPDGSLPPWSLTTHLGAPQRKRNSRHETHAKIGVSAACRSRPCRRSAASSQNRIQRSWMMSPRGRSA